MKRNLFMILLLLGVSVTKADTISVGNNLSSPYFGFGEYLPDYRDINGGTKIIVNYEGNWPEEMRGAFEYSVKMFEEVLPPMLPLRITASLGEFRGAPKQISKVDFTTYSFNGMWDEIYAVPSVMVKNVLLEEYHNNHITQFYDEIEDASFFDNTDIKITYNKNLVDYLSFSLDGSHKEYKYDFISIALRDIGMGLGFGTRFLGSNESQVIYPIEGKLTPFENVIMQALDAHGDMNKAFTNATKGKLPIDINVENSYLYAPTTWQDGVSLRYFDSQKGNTLSQLLTQGIGLGYVFRNISDIPWPLVFQTALGCYPNIPAGGLVGGIFVNGNNLDILPYKGSFTFKIGSSRNVVIKYNELPDSLDKNSQGESSFKDQSLKSNSSESVMQYLNKFNMLGEDYVFLRDVFYTLSVLKKDGTWDVVYGTGESNYPFTLNVESLVLHYPEEEYARSVTGGLKYRLTKSEPRDALHTNDNRVYTSKYFTRNFTPQKAKIKYTDKSVISVLSLDENNSDDYYVDVKVGISDIEGATRVVVEQLDEGEALPFTYEVKDFRNGYFIANLDRELSTQLTVTSYNDYGYRRSNTIVIPPIGYNVDNINFSRNGNEIIIEGIPSKLIESQGIIYNIQEVMSGTRMKTNMILENNILDISEVPNGIYAITIYDKNKMLGQYKFVK